MKLEDIRLEGEVLYLIYGLDESEKEAVPQYIKNAPGQMIYLGSDGFDLEIKYEEGGKLLLPSRYNKYRKITDDVEDFIAYIKSKKILNDNHESLLFKYDERVVISLLNIESEVLYLNQEIKQGMKKNDALSLIILLDKFNRNINGISEQIDQFKQQLTHAEMPQLLRDNLSEKVNLLSLELNKMRSSLTLIDDRISSLSSEKNIKNIRTDKFNYVIDNLMTITNPQFIQNILLNENTSIARLVYKGAKLPNGIKRIALYIMPETGSEMSHVDSKSQKIFNDAANNSIFEVTYESGEKKMMRLEEGIASANELKAIFVEEKAQTDYSMYSRGVGPLGSNFFGGGLKGYNPEIERDYERIHKEIDSQLVKLINKAEQPIELLFIGCGKGDEIEYIQSYLETHQIKYVIYGLDKEKENINEAEEKAKFKGKNVYFMAGDASDIDQQIKVFRKKGPQQIGTSIVVSSGFLTRLVNTDSTEAFEIFKKAAHFSDNIIISGRTNTFISKRDAKSSGMNNTQILYMSEGKDRTLDLYTVKPINEDAKRSFSKGNIDLHDHARPIDIIVWHMQNKTDFNLIDLRNAYIDLEQKTAINNNSALEILVQLIINENISIKVTGNEPWYGSLRNEIAKKSQNALDRVVVSSERTRVTKFKLFDGQIITERPKISENLEERAKEEVRKLTK